MIRKLLPLLLAATGLLGGGAAGLYLRPAEPAQAGQTNSETLVAEGEGEARTAEEKSAAPAEGNKAEASGEGPEYVKLNNQFIVPVLTEGRVTSLVILTLGLEVTAGSTEHVYAREPKLRDAILQVLFDHANAGGFRGSFTDGSNLILLRKALLEKAQSVLGPEVTDVLISDIARQDS